MYNDDSFFYLNYDFLTFLEQLKKEFLPRDLELVWQLRRNSTLDEVLYQLFKWVVQEGRTPTRRGFKKFLELVEDWYAVRLVGIENYEPQLI